MMIETCKRGKNDGKEKERLADQRFKSQIVNEFHAQKQVKIAYMFSANKKCRPVGRHHECVNSLITFFDFLVKLNTLKCVN